MGKQETLPEVRQDWTKHTGEERRGRDKLNKLDTRHTYYIFVVEVNVKSCSSVSQVERGRRCHSSSVRVEVRNLSSLVLGAGALWVKGGEAVSRPGDIYPGDQAELLVTRDSHGNHGTLALRLGSSPLLMIVMWTSGINCDHFANTLAVGVSSNQNTDKFK